MLGACPSDKACCFLTSLSLQPECALPEKSHSAAQASRNGWLFIPEALKQRGKKELNDLRPCACVTQCGFRCLIGSAWCNIVLLHVR